ncbi:MAG TPA: hypothetical protein VG733_11140 [Chthoniobacteraceae bacterium]|nr:hypothetical protein [Chthoniobacteraceae bacterium]
MSNRKSHAEYLMWGRLWLVIVFLLLRVIDLFAYLSRYEAHTKIIILAIVTSNLWSIVLLTGIWLRQGWARVTLITMLFLWLGAGVAYTGFLQDFFADKYGPVFAVGCACYLSAALILLVVPSIHKLTSRQYG